MTPEREQLKSIKQSLLAHPISITGSNEGFYDTNIDLFFVVVTLTIVSNSGDFSVMEALDC